MRFQPTRLSDLLALDVDQLQSIEMTKMQACHFLVGLEGFDQRWFDVMPSGYDVVQGGRMLGAVKGIEEDLVALGAHPGATLGVKINMVRRFYPTLAAPDASWQVIRSVRAASRNVLTTRNDMTHKEEVLVFADAGTTEAEFLEHILTIKNSFRKLKRHLSQQQQQRQRRGRASIGGGGGNSGSRSGGNSGSRPPRHSF